MANARKETSSPEPVPLKERRNVSELPKIDGELSNLIKGRSNTPKSKSRNSVIGWSLTDQRKSVVNAKIGNLLIEDQQDPSKPGATESAYLTLTQLPKVHERSLSKGPPSNLEHNSFLEKLESASKSNAQPRKIKVTKTIPESSNELPIAMEQGSVSPTTRSMIPDDLPRFKLQKSIIFTKTNTAATNAAGNLQNQLVLA